MMRDLINIMNAIPKKGSMAFLQLLEARRYADWEIMLIDVELMSRKWRIDEVTKLLTEAKALIKALGRKDRQVWAARIIRVQCLRSLKWRDRMEVNNSPEYTKEVDALWKKHFREMMQVDENDTGRGPDFLKLLNVELKHFLGLPIAQIQDYDFSKTPNYEHLITEFKAIEKAWKAKITGLILPRSDDKILNIKCPDGFVWFLLDRPYCPDEAKAMGHCGNEGGDGRILSLRKLKGEIEGRTYYSVYATFILHDNGRLGEMKGRGNEAPVAKYYPAIIALLKDPIIKGVDGGGYLPQNNFNVDDLSPEQQDDLFNEKLAVATLKWRLKKHGLTDEIEQEVHQKLAKSIYGYRLEWTNVDRPRWKNGRYGMLMMPRLSNFFPEIMSSYSYKTIVTTHRQYRNQTGEDYKVTTQQMEQIWNKLPVDTKQLIVDELEDNDTYADIEDFSSLYIADDDAFENGLLWSLRQATAYAITASKFHAMKIIVSEALKNVRSRHSAFPIELNYHIEDGLPNWDKELIITISEEAACELAQNVDVYVEEFGFRGQCRDFVETVDVDVSALTGFDIELDITAGVDFMRDAVFHYRSRRRRA